MAVPTVSPAKKQAATPRTGKKRKQPSSCTSEGNAGPTQSAAAELDAPVRKRTKSPGVRIVGGRIYDSENGKTCHQCRQKTLDFAARCSNAKNKKPCTIHFCHKCLLNRYGENAEEMAAKGDWICPKCRDICNCSFCMKKKGQQPTGILAHTAKAIGCSSVSEMLMMNIVDSQTKKMVVQGRKSDTGNSLEDGRKNEKASDLSSARKSKKDLMEEMILKGSSSNQSKKQNAIREKRLTRFKSEENGERSKLKRETQNTGGNNLEREAQKYGGSNLEREAHNSGLNNLERETLLNGANLDSEKGKFHEQVPTKSGKKERKKTNDQRKGSMNERKSKKITKAVVDSTSGEKEFVETGVNNVNGKGVIKVDKEKNHTIRTNAPKTIREMLMEGDNKVHVEAEGLHKNCQKKKDPKPELEVPQGTTLRTIAGIEFQIEDVGPALQFLEFCSVFGKLLDMKKGQPELILRELASGRGVRRGLNSKIVQFYITVLSIIRKEQGDEDVSYSENDGTWMRALQKCVDEAHISFDDLNFNSIAKSTAGYATLDSSKKLKILNFLCDELLGTSDARSFIDTENANFKEKKKEEREKFLAAKEKKKILEKKLKDDTAQAMLELRNGAPLTVSDQMNIISQIKTQMKKTCHELLASSDKKGASVIRTEPVLLEGEGKAFWRLHCYKDDQILLQDFGERYSTVHRDQWFFYESEEEKALQKYLFSRVRLYRSGLKKPALVVAHEE